MGEKKKEQKNPHAKETYRVANETHLLFGVLDFRYAVVMTLPAVFAALHYRSFKVFVVAWVICQWAAYRIYSRDAALPLVFLRTWRDKKHLCPFMGKK